MNITSETSASISLISELHQIIWKTSFHLLGFFFDSQTKICPKTKIGFRLRCFVVFFPFPPGGGIVGQGGERIRAIIEELGCEVQVSREPLAGIAGHKRVAWRTGTHGFFSSKQTFFFRIVKCEDVIFI